MTNILDKFDINKLLVCFPFYRIHALNIPAPSKLRATVELSIITSVMVDVTLIKKMSLGWYQFSVTYLRFVFKYFKHFLNIVKCAYKYILLYGIYLVAFF